MAHNVGTVMATPILPLVDRIMAGRLRETLQEYRSADLSYEGIARRIATDHQIEVVSETVRKWCLELDIQDPQAKASA